MKHTVIVVDDEELARRSIKVLLRGNDKWEIVGEARDGKEAIRLINQLKPELIFLDIDMPLVRGLEMLRRIEHEPYVVFITAHDSFAVEAFEENAVDYLLKPYTDKRFYRALDRVRAKIEERESLQKMESITQLLQGGQSRFAAKPRKKISVNSNDRIILVEVDEICWVSASGNYVELFTEGKKYLHYESMTNMEQLLPEPEFLRIHRSHIVRRDQIKSLKKHSNGEFFVVLRNDTQLKLSRSYRNKVETILGI
jgi:two-component system, LytTR family, response regulator